MTGTPSAQLDGVVESTFTPMSSALGGALIGLSAATLFGVAGRIAGISGITGGLFSARPGDRAWRVAFAVGLFAGGLAFFSWMPERFGPSESGASLVRLIGAGLLVGIGTQMGGGCTSGHGVCGLSRVSKRSIAATLLFMAAAMIAVALLGQAGAS